MSKPNIIYIFADQLRDDWTHDPEITPNICGLREQSVELSQAVSGHPVCAPYRASLFTGKYTTSTGMVINEIRLNPAHHPHTFAGCLTENGYAIEYIGKWHMYANEWGNHLDPKNSFVPPGEHRLGFDGFFAHYGFHHEYVGESNYYHLDTDEKIFHDGYEPDCVTDLDLSRLEGLAAGGQPFSLFLSLGTPHDPWEEWNVPEKYLELVKDMKFKLPENYLPENDPHADAWARLSPEEREALPDWMRVYTAMTANLDENIGRLMTWIDKLGLAENTIVVFTSDHGEMFGAHGRRAKNVFYEEALRVPFLIRLPGQRHVPWHGKNCCRDTAPPAQAHRHSSGLCDVLLNTVDIMPTLLGLCGVDVPAEVEGMDLHKAIEGNEEAAAVPNGQLCMCTGPTADFYDGHEWRAWRTARWTYAQYLSDGEEHLYDRDADPLQRVNLACDPVYVDVREELREQMLSEMARIKDEFKPNTYYRDEWVTADRLIVRTAKRSS